MSSKRAKAFLSSNLHAQNPEAAKPYRQTLSPTSRSKPGQSDRKIEPQPPQPRHVPGRAGMVLVDLRLGGNEVEGDGLHSPSENKSCSEKTRQQWTEQHHAQPPAAAVQKSRQQPERGAKRAASARCSILAPRRKHLRPANPGFCSKVEELRTYRRRKSCFRALAQEIQNPLQWEGVVLGTLQLAHQVVDPLFCRCFLGQELLHLRPGQGEATDPARGQKLRSSGPHGELSRAAGSSWTLKTACGILWHLTSSTAAMELPSLQ